MKEKLSIVKPIQTVIYCTCPNCSTINQYKWIESKTEFELCIVCTYCENKFLLLLPGQSICGGCNGEGITLHEPMAGADMSESFEDKCSRCGGKGYV